MGWVAKRGRIFIFSRGRKKERKNLNLNGLSCIKGTILFFFLMEEFGRVLSLKRVEWRGGCKGNWKLVSLVNFGRNSFWRRLFNLVCDIICHVQLISEGRGLMESLDFFISHDIVCWFCCCEYFGWVQIHQSSCVVMRRLIMGSILVARLPAAAVMLLLLLVVVAHAERHPLEVKFDHLQPLSRIGLHRQLTAISPSVKISASPEVLGADVSQEEEDAPLSLLLLLLLLFGFFCLQIIQAHHHLSAWVQKHPRQVQIFLCDWKNSLPTKLIEYIREADTEWLTYLDHGSFVQGSTYAYVTVTFNKSKDAAATDWIGVFSPANFKYGFWLESLSDFSLSSLW